MITPELITFLNKWQTLVGALAGGVFSLLVALLIARQVKRAEDRAAAYLLIGEFARIKSMVEQYSKVAESKHTSTEKIKAFVVDGFCSYRARLSPLFELSIARLMNYDDHLAIKMTIASAYIRDMEPILHRIENDVNKIDTGEANIRNENSISNDIDTIYDTYKKIADDANYIILLLNKIVLAKCPSIYKIRRFFKPTHQERSFD